MSWIALIVALAVLLAIDLLVVRGRGGEMSLRAAAVASATWVAVALAFGAVLLLAGERADAEAFLAGYLVEKSLSLDNVFVFLLVFTAFGLPDAERHRLLSYGIVAALALRLVFIVVGAAALAAFGWLSFVFAAFLIWTGWKMLRHRHDHGAEEAMVERVQTRLGRLVALDRRRRPGGDRDRRRHLRRRLGARDPRHHERHLHRLRRQRVRAARPAAAVLPRGGPGGAPLLPQDLARRAARLHRREDGGGRVRGQDRAGVLAARDRRDPRHRRRRPRSSAIAARYFANAISRSHPRRHNPLRRQRSRRPRRARRQRPLAHRRRSDRPRRQRHHGRGREPQPRRAPLGDRGAGRRRRRPRDRDRGRLGPDRRGRRRPTPATPPPRAPAR